MKISNATAIAFSCAVGMSLLACDDSVSQDTTSAEDISFSCTTESLKDNSGVKIICNGDSIGVVLNGTDGKDGKDGIDGVDGKDGANGKDGKDGDNGDAGVAGKNGEDGAAGEDGADGKDGEDGVSCTAIPLEDESGFKVICGKDSIGVLLNGEDGADGKDGKDGENGTDGANGLNGTDGKDGEDGYSPVVTTSSVSASEEHPNGGTQIIISYKDAKGTIKEDTLFVWNGTDGKDGQDFIPSSSSYTSSSSESASSSSEASSSNIQQSSSSEISSSSEESSSSLDDSAKDSVQISSSSTEETASSSSAEESSSSAPAAELSEACKTMRATQDSFIPLADIFDCVLPNEKVAFVIRHAERNHDDHTTTGDLNAAGYSQASYLGKALSSQNHYEFNYMSTSVYRTMRTNILISQNKGEDILNWDNVSNGTAKNYIISEDFTESWFQKVSSIDNCAGITSWSKYTKFAYDTTACSDKFYNVDEKVKELINKHFMYENIGKSTIVISHDQFVAPFLISVTDRKINLRAYEYVKNNGYDNDWNAGVFNHWPNYLSGAAIIINENNERIFVPVKGLKTGLLGEHCPNNNNEDNLYTCSKWY